MANVPVKNSVTGTTGTGAEKSSRYEKAEVGFGQVKVNSDTPNIVFGDTAVFNQFPIKEVIEARFVSNAATPDVLDIGPGESLDSAKSFTVAKDATKIDYVVSYIKGTGNVAAGNQNGIMGPALKVTLLPNAAAITYPNAATKTATTATLKASVQPQGDAATVSFQYGTTTGYGTTVAAAQSPLALGTATVTPVTAAITGLVTATLYHFRAVVTTSAGTVNGTDQTFTTD